ncbi:MAG: filamentous hemagglutinin family protein, partial [Gammaproteobacteria bacterium]
MNLKINRQIRNQFLSSLIGFFAVTPCVLAAPQGGVVVGGSGSIKSNTTNTTNVNQNSQSMVVNWSSFNVNANESVNFVQPSSTAAVLNQIYDQSPSQILGSINANGRVFLSNPNGMIFGPSSVVNVGALMATNLSISADDFMAGNYSFGASTNSAGAIINQGIIQAATGGSVALIGSSVKNEGVILANYGHVALATGRQATINFDGDGLLNFQIDESVLENTTGAEDAIHNSGSITADAGQILLSANASEGIFTNVINNDGLIKATRIENIGGVIHLSGNSGRVISSGDITAAGENGVGGAVHLLGNQVGLFGDASIDASGSQGGGVVLIGGDFQGNNPDVQNAQQTYVGADTSIKADAIDSGDGGKVIVWADKTTQYYGDISAQGGEVLGDGGFVEVSGKQWLDFQGEVDTKAINGFNGTLLLDPTNITIQTAGADTVESASGPPEIFSDTATPATESILLKATLESALTSNNVVVRTNSGAASLGNITVASEVNWVTNSSLTLQAENNIVLTQRLNGGTTGSINLTADADLLSVGGSASNSVGNISGAGTLAATAVTLSAATGITTGNITATSVSVSNSASGNVDIINTSGTVALGMSSIGTLNITSTGNISQSGALSVGQTSAFDAGAGTINLTTNGNDFVGAVTLSTTNATAGAVKITDANE